ncbi:MAG TPA: sigma-70 family RNA polymerase sigma factor [Microvirga sp.]|jgi:RNA polymerase sigma-70 factor (ECF subfamily)
MLDRHVQNHLAAHLVDLLELPGASPQLAAILARYEAALLRSGQSAEPWFIEGILGAAPHLRAFAVSLTGDLERADDLVQETLLRALNHRDKFQAGTNLEAWLFTILRNHLYTQHRKKRREVEDADGAYALALSAPPEQPSKMEMQDLHVALARLPPEQREAVLLVGAEGLTYEDAAIKCGVAIGTIKSRVNRARIRLSELMGDTEKTASE